MGSGHHEIRMKDERAHTIHDVTGAEPSELMMTPTFRKLKGWLAVSIGLTAAELNAETPVSFYIFPAGGQRGTEVEVRVGGAFFHGGAEFSMTGEGLVASPRVEENRNRLVRLPATPRAILQQTGRLPDRPPRQDQDRPEDRHRKSRLVLPNDPRTNRAQKVCRRRVSGSRRSRSLRRSDPRIRPAAAGYDQRPDLPDRRRRPLGFRRPRGRDRHLRGRFHPTRLHASGSGRIH